SQPTGASLVVATPLRGRGTRVCESDTVCPRRRAPQTARTAQNTLQYSCPCTQYTSEYAAVLFMKYPGYLTNHTNGFNSTFCNTTFPGSLLQPKVSVAALPRSGSHCQKCRLVGPAQHGISPV